MTPQPRLNATGYSRTALNMKRIYVIFSWGTMTGVFLLGLVVSFYQVYTQL
ncbi:MAG: hypothetical protein BroJett040_21190 [Oligoflexia bacterium]|nr:MAG: hypothetical protein BroJett040_21190 [Oligoflexia bacterium]